LRTLNEPRDDVLQRLKQLLPPWVEIRDSGGGGFHLIIYLKEPVEADTKEFERAGDARSRLTLILCADPAPNHAAALLRKVGTTNFKYESPQLCQVIRPGKPVDITEVEEFLDQLGDAPLFAQVERATNGHDRAAGEPRLRESKAPVDAEARLAAMQYQGAGDDGVHLTQLHCTASLLRSGVPVDEVVAEVLRATRNAAANDPRTAKWDWSEERLTVERLCYDFISKNPELFSLLPDDLARAWSDRLAEGRTNLRIVHSSHIGWHVRSKESRDDPVSGISSNPTADTATQKARGWNYYDTTEITPQNWCVKKLIPQTGVGILSGQWGSFKTTAALDISMAVMTGQSFAGQYRIKRPGAVLYFATEGAGTLQSRLAAIARHRGAPDKLPFAWRSDSPLLTDRNAGQAIIKYVDEAAVHFEHAYGVPIVLIWVDTYITAAGLSSGDDNDVAATQKAFNTLRFVAANSGAFVCTVDHYGKIVEAGTRGSSGKEGNADTVLATLVEREVTGTISNTRMAARKQRDGMSGFETPFTPETVELGVDEDGDQITAIVLDWGKQQQARPASRPRKSKDVALFCQVLADVVGTKGFPFQPKPNGPTVQACHEVDFRGEFYAHCPTKGTAKQRRDRTGTSYRRAWRKVVERGLVGCKEIDGANVLWLR
jgi:AAA domain